MEIQKTQEELRQLTKEIQHPRIGTVLGLYEEVGELAKAVMNWEIYGEKDRDNFREECADVFFSLLDVANAYDIDLDTACESKIAITRTKIDSWVKKYGVRLGKLRSIYDKHD